jgi:uncharacterized protein YigE (DUF2233 family)
LNFPTLSGPILIIDGALHPAFQKGSENICLRNAVGIVPDGRLLFALCKEKINFYDLVTFFKDQGCKMLCTWMALCYEFMILKIVWRKWMGILES